MKQDKLFRVQGDMKKDMQAQLARVLDAQQSSQEALLAALAARPAAPVPVAPMVGAGAQGGATAVMLLMAAQKARARLVSQCHAFCTPGLVTCSSHVSSCRLWTYQVHEGLAGT